MNDAVRRQHHPLRGFMPRLPALGRAARRTARETWGTVAVRLAAAAVLTLVSVAPAWAAADAVTGLTVPRRYPGALPYHLDGGRFAGGFDRGDLSADGPPPRLVAQTSGAPADAGATAAEPEEHEVR